MAGLLLVGVSVLIANGVEQVKSKRAARKASQLSDTDPAEGPSSRRSHTKARSSKRRSRVTKSEMTTHDNSSHSSVGSNASASARDPPQYRRQTAGGADEPPPYEAPPYEPIISDEQLSRQGTAEQAESSRKANKRALKQAKDKQYKEYFSLKNGNFWSLVGVGLASTYGSGYSDKKQFRYWDDSDEDKDVRPKQHRKGAFDVV